MKKQSIIMAGVVAATAVVAPGGVARAAEGDSWRVIRPVLTLSNRDLRDVEAVNATEVWIAGYQYNTEFARFPILQRWDGRSWSAYEAKGIGFEGRLSDLSAAGPNDVWVAGVREDDDTTDLTKTYLGHWNGTSWSTVAAPPADQSGWERRVGADEGGVWLAETSGRVSRWDGTSWTTHLNLGKQVYAIESFSPDEAWLTSESGLYRWDGISWSQVALPAGVHPYHVRIDRTEGVWTASPNEMAIWKDGSWQKTPFPDDYQGLGVAGLFSQYWVHLWRGGRGGWVQWTGSGWVVAPDPTDVTLNGPVVSDSAGRIWGVAYAGFRFTEPSGKLVRFKDGKWEEVPNVPWARYQLRAIPGSDKLIGVGVDGVLGDLRAIIRD